MNKAMKARVTIELEEGGDLAERHEIMKQRDDYHLTDQAVIGSAIGSAINSVDGPPRKILILAEAMTFFDEWMNDEEKAFYDAARKVVAAWAKLDGIKNVGEWAKAASAIIKKPLDSAEEAG